MKSLFCIVIILACVNLGLGLKCYVGGENDTNHKHIKYRLDSFKLGEYSFGKKLLKSCNRITITVGELGCPLQDQSALTLGMMNTLSVETGRLKCIASIMSQWNHKMLCCLNQHLN
ncbi:unnamed protein product [Meganyctiphanes norvegica]|uniref:Uncharacterized protein n=1 Tax=Meganyctiphanes norvegica TaxID=48144 RepID=A0AAV2S482_MEGNR